MINTLVVENNTKTCKRIVNYLALNIANIRVCGIASSIKEGLEIIEKQNVSLAIMDINSSEGKELSKEQLENINCKIILLGSKEQEEKIGSINNGVFLVKPIPLSKITEEIYKIQTDENERSEIKAKIFKELKQLNYDLSHIGTKYMQEAIMAIHQSNEIDCYNLNKNVYPIIAEKHKTSVNTVKCDITAATKIMKSKSTEEQIKRYFRIDSVTNPKVKEIMYTVISRI
jgi:response regulator of citrate/malate metabolism